MKNLKDIPLFREVPSGMLETLEPLLREEQVKAGDVIFREGDSSDRLFIVARGEVEIRKSTDRGAQSHKLIAVLEAGEFFGEMAVFQGEPRSADAVAKVDTTVLSATREALSGALADSPESAFKVMGFLTSVLMQRLRNTTRELVTVYETGRLINSSRSVDELARVVVEGVMSSVEEARAGLFVIWNEFNEEYDVALASGFAQEGSDVLTPDDPLINWLKENNSTFISSDMASDERVTPPEGSPYGVTALIATPFFQRGRLLGFMAFADPEITGVFSYSHMVLLSAIGGYVSVALENLQYMQAEVDRTRLDRGKSTIQPF